MSEETVYIRNISLALLIPSPIRKQSKHIYFKLFNPVRFFKFCRFQFIYVIVCQPHFLDRSLSFTIQIRNIYHIKINDFFLVSEITIFFYFLYSKCNVNQNINYQNRHNIKLIAHYILTSFLPLSISFAVFYPLL